MYKIAILQFHGEQMYRENFKKFKIVALLCLTVILGFTFVTSRQQEKRSCMGVEILYNTDRFNQYVYRDFSDSLRFFDQKAPVDISSSTIYISQKADENTTFSDFEGSLFITDSRYRLYFAYDEYFEDIPQAVKDGHIFRLYVTGNSGEYMQYNVVFTSLPVLKLDGELTDPQAAAGREPDKTDLFKGNVCLWTSYDPDTLSYTVRNSALEWHIRGRTAAEHEKKPYKLSLKKADGRINDVEFLGMGSDDDWLLNAMAFDNTLMREKLFSDLWNDIAAESEYDYPMSEGEFVEAVVNGSYSGVYYLQRRVDRKLLSLDSSNVLLKGGPAEAGLLPEVVYSNISDEKIIELTTDFFSKEDLSAVNVENYIDINIFAQFAYTADNLAHSNIFYILDTDNDNLVISHCFWDTDITFGKRTYNALDLEHTINRSLARHDTDILVNFHPDFYINCLDRWQYLRTGFLSEDNIMARLSQYETVLNDSGAAQRNYERWKHCRNEDDGINELKEFISRRLVWSDGYFAIKAEEARAALS